MKTFTFPDVGEGIAQAEVVEWLVKEGDHVKEDQNIVKVETDKAVVELPSPATGTINKIYKQTGSTVKVGEALVDIDDGEQKETKPQQQEKKAKIEQKPQEESQEQKTEKPKKKEQQPEKKIEQNVPLPKEQTKPISEDKGAQGVVGTIEVGTGKLPPQPLEEPATKPAPDVEKKLPSERRTEKTKETITEKPGKEIQTEEQEKKEVAITKKYDMFGYIDHIPLKGVRKVIAENMQAQARIPTVTHMDDANITKLVKLREQKKKDLTDVKLTYLPFIVKAAVQALQEHPTLASVITETEIIIKKYYNIGIAVATPEGLLVPVVKGADDKSIHEIAKEIQDLAEKARNRTLDIMDMKGGSFTITNVGSIGGTYATPIINPGEAAILATGAITERVISVKGKISYAYIMPLSLTFDHRIIDGAEGAQFMNTLKKYLEDPSLLFIDMK